MSQDTHLDELGKVKLATECYVIKDNKVLMFKRSPTASRFPGFWIGPGGHIDATEDALTTIIREIKEEARIEISASNTKLKAVAFHHHIDRGEVWISFVFLATIDGPQNQKSENLEGQSSWIELKELLTMDNIFPPAKYYFDHVLKDQPGILYANITWNKAQLVKVLSRTVDRNG